MKRGDMVKVTTGDHAGQVGRVICVFGGYVTMLRPDSVAVQVKAGDCEVVRD